MKINKMQAELFINIMNDYAELILKGNNSPVVALGRIAGTLERNGYKIGVKEIDGTAKFILQ